MLRYRVRIGSSPVLDLTRNMFLPVTFGTVQEIQVDLLCLPSPCSCTGYPSQTMLFAFPSHIPQKYITYVTEFGAQNSFGQCTKAKQHALKWH
jgi:hypothetical protein